MRNLLLGLVIVAALFGMWLTSRQPVGAGNDGWYVLTHSLSNNYVLNVMSTDDDTACIVVVEGQGVAALDNAICDAWRPQPFTPYETPTTLPARNKLPRSDR